MLCGADPVRVDRLHMARVGLATPAEQELLGRCLPPRDDVVRHGVRVPVREPRRARDDPHHLRGEPPEVLACLLIGDLVQLAELPLPREPGRLGLEIGRRVPRQASRLVRLGLGHPGVEVVVDEQAPHVLVRVVADELLDVDAAVAEHAAFAVGLGDLGLDGDDAFEPRLEVGHRAGIYPNPVPPGTARVEPVAHRVTLIPGDGTGPELTEATRRVLEATGVAFDWDVQEAGADVMEAHDGNPLPEETLASIRDTGVALKGPITTPIGTGFRSVNVALRHELNLYACLRPCKTYPGVRTRYEAVDVVIVRENTEDLYAGIEFESGSEAAQELIATLGRLQPKQISPKSGISVKPMSPEASERIIRFAFDYARAQGRRAVHGITKANIMKHTDGLFLEVFRHVAAEYTDIEPRENLVDALCMGLVQRPEEYDVLVLPNLYGDIVSDLAAGLVGGLGVAPGANIGADAAVFEATHGSAPKYRGQNKVNPIAMILSGKLMLDHLEEPGAAARLESAVAAVIAEGKSLTYDMKPTRDDPSAVGTSEVADAIIDKLGALVT